MRQALAHREEPPNYVQQCHPLVAREPPEQVAGAPVDRLHRVAERIPGGGQDEEPTRKTLRQADCGYRSASTLALP